MLSKNVPSKNENRNMLFIEWITNRGGSATVKEIVDMFGETGRAMCLNLLHDRLLMEDKDRYAVYLSTLVPCDHCRGTGRMVAKSR